MYMIGNLMGLPEVRPDQLLNWSDLFAAGDEELIPQIEQAVVEGNDYIVAHARRSDAPDKQRPDQPDVDAEREGQRLSDVDLMFESMLVLVGGDETTRHASPPAPTPCCATRATRRPARRSRPHPPAVEEMLRWATPGEEHEPHGDTGRRTVRPADLEGDRMLLLFPSANRDEAVSPIRPLRRARNPNPHVAFGAYGRHHCLGAPLARLELRVLFEECSRDSPRSNSSNPTARAIAPGNFVVGIETLPIRFRSA